MIQLPVERCGTTRQPNSPQSFSSSCAGFDRSQFTSGGNGCRVLHGLAQLHLAMKALGHRYGLSVTSYDADVVSAANIGRTVFSASDIGQYKATVLTQRINCAYDLDWTAVPKKIDGQSAFSGCDILISCVDSAKARRTVPPSSARGGRHPRRRTRMRRPSRR